jgi:enediyne biosynthesis protein E4
MSEGTAPGAPPFLSQGLALSGFVQPSARKMAAPFENQNHPSGGFAFFLDRRGFLLAECKGCVDPSSAFSCNVLETRAEVALVSEKRRVFLHDMNLIRLLIKPSLQTASLVLALLLMGNSSQAQSTTVTFTDVTAAAGMQTTGFAFGNPIWGDFDSDGKLDLFVDNHYNRPPYVYHNNGNGTFTDISASSGIIQHGDRHGSAWADFNNDGYLDLYWTKGAKGGSTLGMKKDELYLNQGNLTFVNTAEAAGTTNTWGRARGVAWADFNHDGYLDIVVGNLRTLMVVFQNNGDGTFADVTTASGVGEVMYQENMFVDYDNDGWADIFSINSQRGSKLNDRLYRNNHDGTFTDVSRAARLRALSYGRSAAWGDYNNDGYLDVYISRGQDESPASQTLYKNNGNGTFTEVTAQAGLTSSSNNRAAMWGDYDNDGFLDLYVVNSGSDPIGKGPNHLYRNNGDGTFTDVAPLAGVADAVVSRGRGATWGDYDGDGFLDLFVTNGEDDTDFEQGPQTLFHNNANNSNHWLEIVLVGTSSNRQGLGAAVTIQTNAGIQYRQADGGSGHFLSQGAAPIHFGLGQQTAVNQLTVNWPSGIVQTVSEVAANQKITITEGN